ncbi:MFS general substrate transporter [Mollisia scopiformis]|uniref:MFS general substrate transporter n=1 Tax=Mollisia scopiformis TaxID=149040 RepID=A0A132BFA8_MOLSC|nr:MFS general substrate transporter [Mollisia scopiformis]KUJ10554.1 MFS general substrate transporter [Mollisia scopiformis]
MDDSTTSDANSLNRNSLGEKEKREGEKDGIPVPSNDSSSEQPTELQEIPEVLTGYPLVMLIAAISLAGFLYSLDVTIIVTAVPVITTHFHRIQDIGWYGSAYLITLCAIAPLTGKLYQFYNSKITFFTFVVIFEIGSLICGVAPTSTALIVGRAVAGIGGAGIFSGGFTIVATSAPKEKRTQLVAFIYAFAMLGSIISPIIGGVLTEKASWRWCFYINLPAGAVTLVLIAFIRIPEAKAKRENRPTLYESVHRLDPIGFALFAPFCIMVLLPLQWGGSTYSWNSSIIIGLFVGAAACLAVFIFWESRRGDTAMVPLSILCRRVIYSSCLVVAAQYGSLSIFAYYLPVWFQTILGVSPIKSGVYFMATAATVITVTFMTGIIAGKLGTPTIFVLVGNLITTVGGGLMSTFNTSTRTGAWVGYQILTGFGRGMTLQQPINAAQHALDPSTMAVGTSLVIFCQYFGGAVFLALAETDFSSSLRSALREYAAGVDSALIFEVGASGVRAAVTSEQLPGVLKAYNEAITNTFYLACAASAAAFLAAWGMGLKSIKKKKEPTADTTEEA